MDAEQDFGTFFRDFVNQYQLSPQMAAVLLKNILAILQKNGYSGRIH